VNRPGFPDTFEPLEIASFELYGRQVAGGVVATPGVIEHLDVVEDIGPGLIARRIDLSANALSLEQLEEARVGGRHAVAVALEVHQAGGRDTLGVLDETIEGPGHRHEQRTLLRPDFGDGARQLAVGDLAPQRLAALLQPAVEQRQRGKRRHGLPQSVPRITHVLLDLALLPAGGRVAELGLEQVVTDHGAEARVDVSLLAAAYLVHGRLHVVVDAPSRYAAEHLEGSVVRVEQHLVGLQQIGAHDERAAVAELEVRHLQLGALAGDDSPVLAPVELECLARAEGQRHEGAASGGLLHFVAVCIPLACKGRHAVVRPLVAQRCQIGVHLLERAALLAGLGGLALEPAAELLGKGVELARADALRVAGRRLALAKVLADGVARQARAPGYLSNGQLLSQCPTSDDTQCRHVNHSCAPAAKSSRLGLSRGSDLDGNHTAKWVTSEWKSTPCAPLASSRGRCARSGNCCPGTNRTISLIRRNSSDGSRSSR